MALLSASITWLYNIYGEAKRVILDLGLDLDSIMVKIWNFGAITSLFLEVI